MKLPSGYDIIGDIAILKFSKETGKEKIKIAKELLKERKNIKTVVEKAGRIKGRLRTIKTKFLSGEKTSETIHNESGCKFKIDINKCYFSPRLSNDRLEVAKMINKKDNVLVMFSGIGPYAVIISRYSKARVIAVELGRDCCKYAVENVQLNKLQDKVTIIQGDVKRVLPKLAKKEKFDKIMMARPNLKDTFLREAFSVAGKGCEIFYHGFGNDIGKILEQIYVESKKYKKKIRIIRVKKAGDIAPYKFRYRIDFKVLN